MSQRVDLFAAARIMKDDDTSVLAQLNLPFPLRQYQEEGVFFLLGNESALLADEMGLGKTVQTLVAVRALISAGARRRALIVVPKSLRLNWYEEAKIWAPDLPSKIVTGNKSNRLAAYSLPFPILIATYEQIASDWKLLSNLGEEFTVAILDEAQRIKNPSSRAAWSCRLIPRQRSWALTGTPLENKVEDLHAIFRFINPDLLTGSEYRSDLHELIKPHFLRRTKSQVFPDFPEISTRDLHLSMTGAQAAAYRAEWASRHKILRRSADWSSDDTASALALITKLKQICNFDQESGDSVKLEALKLILEEVSSSGGKILIFSQYVRTLKWLKSKLSSFRLDIYSGEQDEKERNDILRTFRTSRYSCGLLISLRAGGVGLNLQEASTVVVFDRWWNPAVENQAIQRAHRFGRTEALYVVRFLVVESIEERIAEILAEKHDLFEDYVEEADSAEVLERKEILRLLA